MLWKYYQMLPRCADMCIKALLWFAEHARLSQQTDARLFLPICLLDTYTSLDVVADIVIRYPLCVHIAVLQKFFA